MFRTSENIYIFSKRSEAAWEYRNNHHRSNERAQIRNENFAVPLSIYLDFWATYGQFYFFSKYSKAAWDYWRTIRTIVGSGDSLQIKENLEKMSCSPFNLFMKV